MFEENNQVNRRKKMNGCVRSLPGINEDGCAVQKRRLQRFDYVDYAATYMLNTTDESNVKQPEDATKGKMADGSSAPVKIAK